MMTYWHARNYVKRRLEQVPVFTGKLGAREAPREIGVLIASTEYIIYFSDFLFIIILLLHKLCLTFVAEQHTLYAVHENNKMCACEIHGETYLLTMIIIMAMSVSTRRVGSQYIYCSYCYDDVYIIIIIIITSAYKVPDGA